MQTQAGFEPMTPKSHIKDKKKLDRGGFELQISGHECKTLPLSYCVITNLSAYKY